jgi:hypothetical protein
MLHEIHTKSHDHWHRRPSNNKVSFDNLKGRKVGITDKGIYELSKFL